MLSFPDVDDCGACDVRKLVGREADLELTRTLPARTECEVHLGSVVGLHVPVGESSSLQGRGHSRTQRIGIQCLQWTVLHTCPDMSLRQNQFVH